MAEGDLTEEPGSSTRPSSPCAHKAHLQELWDLPALDSRSEAILSPGELPRPAGELIQIGNGNSLASSGGTLVRLPGRLEDSQRCLRNLECWAYALLSESYMRARPGSPTWMLRAYYALRPLVPRRFQLMLRRFYAKSRAAKAVLRWPIDGLYVALAEAYLAVRLESSERSALSVARRWPVGYRAGATLTHDVEGAVGQSKCRDVAALEESKGFRSSFNFVAERYRVDIALMEELRARGFEIGLHGIKHDGKKFSSRRVFDQRVRRLAHYRDAWGVEGFRSPATHRRWDWMPELPFAYDSSYPDTDPFEPLPGGCGSPWPFRLGDLVELPITMPQDHTSWEILRQPALGLWRSKVDWLVRCGGLINIVVHPDYLNNSTRWNEYEAFLDVIRATTDVWVQVPKAIARWWRERTQHRELVTLQQVGDNLCLVFGHLTA